jgi:hypothetical protein
LQLLIQREEAIMDLVRLDDEGCLYLSPDIDDWGLIASAGITTIIDLDSGIDEGVPTASNKSLYIYFPFNDYDLPDLERLHAVGQLGATLVKQKHKVLSHCGVGFNRSALVAGLILRYLGMKGSDIVPYLRERRPGALYNKIYADYLTTCQVKPL